jgi:glycosyltransferase involved in cell wall biosynthesis
MFEAAGGSERGENMRVLFSYGVVGRGGDAIQVRALMEAFEALGHYVEPVGSLELQPYEFATRASMVRGHLRRLPWWGKDILELGLNLRTLLGAKRKLGRGNFDLVFHRAGIYDFTAYSLVTSNPLIAHLDGPFEIERKFLGEGQFTALHRKCMRNLGERASLVVTMSDASRDYYADLGIPQDKILVVPNGISSQLLQVGKALAEAHPPLSEPRVCTIGFVGSLSRWHRVDLLLRALAELERDRYRLHIVGYGSEFNSLQAQARELGLDGRVHWTGPLSHRAAMEAIAEFDIAVLPGTLSTGAPMKPVEYAALARPIIVPDLPNLRAWFSEDEVLFVTPENATRTAEAIRSLCAEPERARMMGQRAQTRVSGYTWEMIVHKMLHAVQPNSF